MAGTIAKMITIILLQYSILLSALCQTNIMSNKEKIRIYEADRRRNKVSVCGLGKRYILIKKSFAPHFKIMFSIDLFQINFKTLYHLKGLDFVNNKVIICLDKIK